MLRPLAAVIAVAAVTGCHAQSGNDGGATVSKNYSVGNFSAIEVAGPYDVEVRTGANPSVSARGSERLLERTVVEVNGDKLVIHTERNHSFFHWGWSSHGQAKFTVTVPSSGPVFQFHCRFHESLGMAGAVFTKAGARRQSGA